MELLLLVIVALLGFGVFDLAAVTKGADSRDLIADDHRR
jgi:hypothetical protein